MYLLCLFSLLILVEQSLTCVDVLFVVDNRTLEVSRNRAIQVAKTLPENQKIRKWVTLSRNDRYVPRVLRNNAELQSVLATINGDYDRFLEIATGEISRRTATFQPFVILLFSETPVNQTMTNMWRKMSLAPALHIYRIGSLKRQQKMLSEDQETDFENLIQCGRNRTDPIETNEIRRSPTSTHRPLTSTRDPYIRRLTFYDASRTLLEDKPKKSSKKPFSSKYTFTRTFRKITTPSTTRWRFVPSTTTELPKKITASNKKSTARLTTLKTTTSTKQKTTSTTRKPIKLTTGTKKSLALTTKKPIASTKNSWKFVPSTTTARKPSVSNISKSTAKKSSVSSTTKKPSKVTTSTKKSWIFVPSTTPTTRKTTRKSYTTPKTTKLTTTRYRSVFSTTSTKISWKFVPSTTSKPYQLSKTARSQSITSNTTKRFHKPFTKSPTTRSHTTTTRKSLQFVPSTTTKLFTTTRTSAYATTTTKKSYQFTTTTRNPYFTTSYQYPTSKTKKQGLAPKFSTKSYQFVPTTTSFPIRNFQKSNLLDETPIRRFTTTIATPVTSSIEAPPENQIQDTEFRGKNFKVRSRSVHFAMTEKPPVSSTMNLMSLFTTSKQPRTTSKSRIPFSCTADVFFLVDLSLGTGDKSQQYLDIAASAISSLPISQEAVRVGLISYSGPGRTHVRVHLDKHSDKEKLIEEMFLMERHGGTTRTADAIRYATNQFESTAHPSRNNVKKMLIVFTDGYSQDNPKEAARLARAKGVQLVAVAVKDKLAPPDQMQLTDIGGNSRNVFISPTGRELREKILGTQCRL